MLDRFPDVSSSASSVAIRKTRRAGVRPARRYFPQMEGVLERREVLSPFPFTGNFSGPYTVLVEGPGPTQTVSGTISVSIAATSTQSLGDGLYQAYISGSVTFTGFLGQSATYPFNGNDNQQLNGIETGNASTGLEPSVDITLQAYYPDNPLNFVLIEGYCTNNAIVASCDIGLNNYLTPNAAAVTLGGAPSTPTPILTPTPVELTGASVVKAKKGASQIVVDFNDPLGGGLGLTLSDFQLTTVAKGRKHAKMIPLASVAYNPATDSVTLTPRRKLNYSTPLKLTISGLAGGPSTLVLTKHGASVAAIMTGQAGVNTVPSVVVANPASLSADAVDVVFI
jgi:hypothetical protein